MSESTDALMRREFDIVDHERLARIEERLGAHIAREEEMERRWCEVIRDNQRAIRQLADEFAKMREASAARNGAERALLWLGGALFTGGIGVIGMIVSLWDKLGGN